MLTESWEENRKMNGNFFNIALSLVGIVLGGFSLYLFSTHDKHSNTVERLNTLETRIQQTQEQIEALSFSQNEQIAKALAQIQKGQSNRPEAKRQSRAAAATPSATTATTSSRTAEAASLGNMEGVTMKEHVIRPGDTLGKIASDYGVPLRRIMDANPTIVPARLQVGQVVHIPMPN